mgnify:CR=1 FL=1
MRKTASTRHFYRKYLKAEFQIERYEWESCGNTGTGKFPEGKKQYASSLLSDQYLAVLSTVRSVHQRKPQRADAGAGMPEVLRKTGVFISGASADDGEI